VDSSKGGSVPAPLDPEIIKRVREFWAAKSHTPTGDKRSRRDVYSEYVRKKWGKDVSWGKFNNIISETERNAPATPFPTSEWHPWVNPEESTEDSAFLLQLNAVKQVEFGVGLHMHEANWGRRLRAALDGLHPFGQYRFVIFYSMREMISYYLRQELRTLDLDNFVAYKPWLPGNSKIYELALASGMAPKLQLDLFNLLSDLPLPEPENRNEEVWLSWWPQVYVLFTPWGTHIPGRENDPERARLLDALLKLWAGILPTVESTQEEEEGATDEREHS
jgi:hypothetical protein